MSLKKLLEKLAQCLSDHQIPYIIIGGQAVLLYGEPRLTKDIDVTLGIGPDKLERIESVIQILDLNILISDVKAFVQRTFVLPTQESNSGFRIDFIFSTSAYEKKAIQRAVHKRIGHTNVMFSSLEDLIIHKIFAGRERDMEDVKNVILKNKNFDRNYIRKWLKEFDRSLDTKFVIRFNKLLKELNLSV